MNLDAAVVSAALRFGRLGDAASASAWVAALHLRSTIAGSVEDLEDALRVAEQSVASTPNDARSFVLLGSASAALHRFDEAVRALDVADSYGHDVRHARGSVRVAQGDYGEELERRLERAERYPSFQSYADLAPALVAAGRFVEADWALVDALGHYRDVSPLTVAWVQFQRGVIWGESVGDSERAEVLYRDAIRLAPGYVTASVHLAEIEAENGDLDDAITRLRAVADVEDPEPMARLAEFLRLVDADASRDAETQARAGWEALLSRQSLAFADHAAEFFLGAGDDPQRALELAQLNLENRETSRSYELAIGAALAVGDRSLACDYLRAAGSERSRIGLVEARALLRCDGAS
jgi:tetratricopeptide (TPR) repeat protein